MMDNHRETTDIILRYMKHQLDADGFNCPIQFDIQSTESHISEDIHAKVRQLTEDFELKFLETYGDVWTYLDIDNSSEESHELSIEMLTMIHHSLFAEGISWGKIVGLVSLSGSFTRKWKSIKAVKKHNEVAKTGAAELGAQGVHLCTKCLGHEWVSHE